MPIIAFNHIRQKLICEPCTAKKIDFKNAELRKNQIYDASIKLFAQKGFYGTFVEEIIKEAKVGKGTFYRNFKNKEDLFISLLLKFLNEWRQSVSIGMADFNENTYTAYIKKIILESFQFFRRNDVLSILYFRIAPGLNDIIEPMLKNFEKEMLQYLISDLQKAQNLGFLKPGVDVKMAAIMVAGAFFRVHYNYFIISDSDKNHVDIDEMVDNFYFILMRGILHEHMINT